MSVYKKLSAPLAIAMIVSLSGCAAAAVGAAGAAGGIAYTDRGAKGDLKGDPSQINQNAKKVFQDMNIHVTDTSSSKAGKERSLEGKSGTMDVSVDMEQQTSGLTHVEVVAKEGTLKWNKDYARDVLAKITEK